MSAIDLDTWHAARPLARRVTPLAFVGALVVAAAVGAVLVLLGQGWVTPFAVPLAAIGGWRASTQVVAARAVRRLRPAVPASSLPAPRLAQLVSRGTTIAKDVRWYAVEDEAGVTLATAAGPGQGTTLPLSVVINLGRSGGA